MLRIGVFILLCALSTLTMALPFTIEISEKELQEKVSALMPMSAKELFITVTVSEPTIELIKETDKVAILLHVEVRALSGLYGTGRGKVVGSISYNADETAFYFQDITVERFELDQIPGEAAPSLKVIAQIVGVAANQAMLSHPIFVLSDDDMKQKLLRSTLESVKVDDGKLLVTMSLL